MDRKDQSGQNEPNKTEWTEQDQIGPKWTEQDRSGPNKTKVD